MRKRTSITPTAIPDLGSPAMAVPYQDTEAAYEALRATGMGVQDTLKTIGAVDPKGAMRLLDIRWDDLMQDKDFKLPGYRGTRVDLSYQNWITGLPEGKEIDSDTDFDLRGCENFVSIPRAFRLDGSLRLEGTSWDELIPLMRCETFDMGFDARITSGDIGSPDVFTGKEWGKCY